MRPIKILSISIAWLILQPIAAQEAILSDVVTLETGFLGFFINYDRPISDRDVLRVEVGLDGSLFGGEYYGYDLGYLLVPKVGMELRRYYDRDRRISRGQPVRGNAGNFFALIADYHPPGPFITRDARLVPARRLQVIPCWGMRRTIVRRWSAEVGIGFGYGYNIDRDDRLGSDHIVDVDLRLRIGYMLWQ